MDRRQTPRLFGTDGIRGVAAEFPLDPPTVERTGFALATVLAQAGGKPRVLIGRDTRDSGLAIEEALTRGLLAGDVKVTSGGVLPTPAVAHLVRALGFDAGVVISASHNPFPDNGIKIISRDGLKLVEALERMIESLVLDPAEADFPIPHRPVSTWRRGTDPLLKTRYLSFLAAAVPRGFTFAGRRVVLDCANGAASALAPEVFRRLEAEVLTLSCEPDGRNINAEAGALHPDRLAEEVRRSRAFLGAAYDGDADRCILVDETGAVRNGDDVLAVAGTAMLEEARLGEAGIVSTVMANFGLERYFATRGVELVRTQVGDRFVVEEMLRRGALLGGEQSGHVVFLDRSTAGDGILTSLLIAHLAATRAPLSALASVWTPLPQLLRNVRVRERVDLEQVPAIAAVLADVRARMEGRGRVLVRYSGTEALVRIMLEGEDQGEIERHAAAIAAAVESSIG